MTGGADSHGADPLGIVPLDAPPRAKVTLPGSKSITNRALLCASLAEGTSRITGVLRSGDTEAMLSCLRSLGVRINGFAEDPTVLEIEGSDGAPSVGGAVLDARSSGTTSRFIAPVCASSAATVVLDGSDQLRGRPMGDLWEAVETLGASVTDLGVPGHLPVEVAGPPDGVKARRVEVRGDSSSQFLSGLLLAAPVMPKGLEVVVTTPLVSVPYVEMTLAVMEAFGARVERHDDLHRMVVAPGGYVARDYRVEPDASAASYFLAVAAVTGGEVTVEGLGSDSLQGDVAFARVLGRMGAEVHMSADCTTVRGTGELRGVEVDMSEISDTAQTLAAIAPLASSATEVEGIGFIRRKETDRIAAVVAELSRLGIDASETPDGFVVQPGRPRPGVVQTYDDHRMAMSFAVLGLVEPGISIADPGCVAKTFPGFWDAVAELRAGGDAVADTAGDGPGVAPA